MTLPKTHDQNIKTRYEGLLGENNGVSTSPGQKSNDKRSLKQILRNVELLTKAIIDRDAE